MHRSPASRRRIGLLASSSLVASTLVAGLAGAALTALTPAAALAAGTCTPTANGTTPSGATTATSLQTCDTNQVGVDYAGNNIVVDITDGASVTTNGISIAESGAGNNAGARYQWQTDPSQPSPGPAQNAGPAVWAHHQARAAPWWL